jgi:hypothetical protein
MPPVAPRRAKKPQSLKIHRRIPTDLPPDRQLVIPASGTPSDGSVSQWVRPGFFVTVPPGIATGQKWHFRVQVGEPNAEWTVLETTKVTDVSEEGGLPGAGTVYHVVSRAVLRVGLDRASKQVGFLERGEQIVCIESRVYSGRTRIRFERGWTSSRSGSGKLLLEKVSIFT